MGQINSCCFSCRRKVEDLDSAKNYKFNIAVIGQRGVGKSSLVNALTAQQNAAVGVIETTQTPTGYRLGNRTKLWDLPGYGTPKHKFGSYLQEKQIGRYNALLILHEKRIRKNDLDMAKIFLDSKFASSVIIVRTKADEDLKNEANDRRQKKLTEMSIADQRQLQSELRAQILADYKENVGLCNLDKNRLRFFHVSVRFLAELRRDRNFHNPIRNDEHEFLFYLTDNFGPFDEELQISDV